MHESPNYTFDDLRRHAATSISNLAEVYLEEVLVLTLKFIKDVSELSDVLSAQL